MTRFVAINSKIGGTQPTEKYVKQTYDAMSNNSLDVELVAMQISHLPVREQKKFFRLLLNYIDITSKLGTYKSTPVTLREVVELCEKLITVVNDYYEEQEQLQLVLEGM